MSLKDRLATRKRPSITYQLRIDDDTVAQSELVAARVADDEGRIVAAQSAVEACYEQVTITALPPAELEELLQANPPPPAEQGKKLFNPVTFVPALLAVCVQADPPVTEEDWAEFTTTGAMTAGEVAGLFNTAWELNYRIPDPNLGKE